MRHSLLLPFILIALLSTGSSLFARPKGLQHDFFLINFDERDLLEDDGVDFLLNYMNETAFAVSGGTSQGGTYTHNINAGIQVDFEKAFDIPSTLFLMNVSNRTGSSVNNKFIVPQDIYGPNYFNTQQIYGGWTTVLVNMLIAYWPVKWIKVDVGQLTMNDYYLRSDLYCNFMNNAICGSPKGVFTPYALSAYPQGSPGIHTDITFTQMFELQLGAFSNVWNNPNNQHGIDWSWRNGTALAAEAQFHFNKNSKESLPFDVKFGANYNTGTFNEFVTEKPVNGAGSLYALLDATLYRETYGSNQGLRAFAAYVWNNNPKISGLPNSYYGGLVYEGLIPARPKDKLGFAMYVGEHSSYSTYTLNDTIYTRLTEYVLELDYNFMLPYGIQFMPDVQYFFNPNGARDLVNPLVLGFQVSITF